MTDLQKDFLKELAGCGVSETALIAVAILVENPKDIAEMADRIADLMEKEGRDPTDGEVLEIMVQMMKGAATPSNPTVTT